MFPSHIIGVIIGSYQRVMKRFAAWETTILYYERSELSTERVGHVEISKHVGVPTSEE